MYFLVPQNPTQFNSFGNKQILRREDCFTEECYENLPYFNICISVTFLQSKCNFFLFLLNPLKVVCEIVV